MKNICFFSDVHSNLWALEAMKAVIQSRQGDCKWYFGGDVVGWLYQPVECVTLLADMMQEGLIAGAVAGNHDYLALDIFSDLENQIARRIATAFSAGAISRERDVQAFLRALPLKVDLESSGCVVTHHSPFMLPNEDENATINHFRYLSEDFESQLAAWASCSYQVILSGHDHIPAVHRIPIGTPQPTLTDVATIFPQETDLTVQMEDGYRYWVQSGAAGGPPRDGLVMLNWVEYVPYETVTLHRVPFASNSHDLKRLIDSKPYGSLLDWERFIERTKKPIAEGGAMW